MVTLDDSPPATATAVAHRYARQGRRWAVVALADGTLISHGLKAVPVRDEVLRQGIECPFVVRIPLGFGLPSAG